MRRLAIVMLCLGLAACGGQDDAEKAAREAGKAMEDAATAAGKAARSAAEEAGKAADAAMEEASEAADAAMDAVAGDDSQSCLDLVAAGKFAEAIPVCTQALSSDPANQAVQDALAKAKAGAGSDAAAGAAEGAMKEMGEQMP